MECEFSKTLSVSVSLSPLAPLSSLELTYFTLPSSGDIIRYYSIECLLGKNKIKQFKTAKKLVKRQD